MFDDRVRKIYQQEAPQAKEKKSEKELYEDTHKRATFLIRKALLEVFDEEIEYLRMFHLRRQGMASTRGIKTRLINKKLEEVPI